MKNELLIFSEKSAKEYGYNTIITTEGKEVKYTHMTDNHDDWRSQYRWEDAVEVGYAESVNDITGFFPSEWEKYRREMFWKSFN